MLEKELVDISYASKGSVKHEDLKDMCYLDRKRWYDIISKAHNKKEFL